MVSEKIRPGVQMSFELFRILFAVNKPASSTTFTLPLGQWFFILHYIRVDLSSQSVIYLRNFTGNGRNKSKERACVKQGKQGAQGLAEMIVVFAAKAKHSLWEL